MNAEQSSMTAPELKRLISMTKDYFLVQDEPTKKAVLALFEELQKLEACGEDELRRLWLVVPRGEIEDFGDYEGYLEDEEVSNREEFERLWLDYYPEPVKWYELAMVSWRGWYSVFLGKNLVLQIQPEPEEQYPVNKKDLAEWILSAATKAVKSVKDGNYNEFVRENLPYVKRKGKILRENYWRIVPEEKEEYLKNISQHDIDRFVTMMGAQPPCPPTGRISEMTAGKFFDCCRLGYEANGCEGAGKLTGKELYIANADGRDHGLLDLDESSAEEFNAWFDGSKLRDAHCWEIFCGSSSSRAHLFAQRDNEGWWLSLSGPNYWRSVEMIKFYLALADAGLPVEIRRGKELADMVTGCDYIGIIPEEIYPVHCGSMFPEESVLSFMNLPDENGEKIIATAYWYPLEEARLRL